MNLDRSRFTELIKSSKFKELFNELGWDKASVVLPVNVDDNIFKLTAVAEKRGFLIFVCSPDANGKIPTKDIRKKIDTKITKVYFEHLIIYTDKNNTHQIWQLVLREQDKPIIVRETDYFSTQHPELLFQRLRGVFISLDDEDKITLADVRSNVREQFNTNAERVTKRFYDEFKKYHTEFLKFIKGIEDNVNKEWYASLMLNRLMFIYFIQKKGFLDNNPNYLHDKLKAIQHKKGKDKFYSFYRNFLLVLFHKGLGSPERNDELIKEIGKVPYLNGGLFDVHQLEKENENIEIPDQEFEKIFNFFDEYNWHLDNRVTATGRDINPDVIGYIFEKYINDRAQMGAYYTKEDITEYISKNTIIPFLFDRVKESVADAFKDDSSFWKILIENPDRYIYDAVKYGISELIPLAPPEEGKVTSFGHLQDVMLTPPTPLKRGDLEVPSNRGDLGVFKKEELRPIPKWYELPYNKNLVMTARDLRKAGNKAEIIFWLQVKNKQLFGLDFDRQKIVGNFIVDFYCKDLAVAVEIDGSSHNDKVEYDEERDNFLKSLGLIVIHYRAEDVLGNIDGLISDLKDKLVEISKLSGTPLAPLKEGNSSFLNPLKDGNFTPLANYEDGNLTPPPPLKNGDLEVPSHRGDLGVFEEFDLDDPNHPLWKDLPNEIKQGFRPELKDKIVVADERPHLWEIRKPWTKQAPTEIALPTEIYREVIERRKRYFEVRNKIVNGEIKEINDFITYNLNIRQFAQDAIEQYEGSDFINAFYKAITKITVLDPTCGSGAFLFAALNILEPLYYACIERMKGFVESDTTGKKFPQFRKVLDEITKHPSQQYFIYKSIILNNLYGVDIMKEAVEIAKLRLFLKLVAEVDDFEHLEPLPDIDFNVRSGNSLIGFATKSELDKGLTWSLNLDVDKKIIYDELDIVAKAFRRYKEIQLEDEISHIDFKKAKDELNERLKNLNDTLNDYLGNDYGKSRRLKKEFDEWLNSHKPFHWFAEFYEIIEGNGGFDVIIGNPPYVEYSKVRDIYTIKNFTTEKCANLYGYVIERCYQINKISGICGMIIPISSISNDSMASLQNFFRNYPLLYFSSFHQRPAQLFEGVLQRLTIFLSRKSNNKNKIYSTKVFRWQAETRSQLFELIYYLDNTQSYSNILKFGDKIEINIFDKFKSHKSIKNYLSTFTTKNKLSYRTAGGGYWVTFLNSEFKTKSLSNKTAYFQQEYKSKVFMSALNSNLFWWYYSINFDQFNFKDYMIFGFQFNYPINQNENKLLSLSDELESELLSNAMEYIIHSKTRGSNKTITYKKNLSKNIMDNIDKVLAEHYGFTEEELDFIINYDIKYRMGKDNSEEE